MALEIERKFLLRNDNWKSSVRRSVRLKQGYLSDATNCSVRVRTSDKNGWLNIKSVTIGAQRHEYEYEIPLADANEILDTLSRKPVIEKIWHLVDVEGHTWEIDVFENDNQGLVVAEIELESPDERFYQPEWLGAEVTDDARYYHAITIPNLLQNPYKNW